MFQIQIDEKLMEEAFLEEVQKRLLKIENRHLFWDLDELSKQTCMSIGNIKDKFFYNPSFPKYKIGGKWYFPAIECEKFLLEWIKQQPKT